MGRHRSGKKSERKIGYAVVGLGDIAQTAVLPAFRNARENSRLAAVISGDARKRAELSERYRVPAFDYDDYEECLARDDVDAVYIALPNTQHAEYTERAARLGVHVLCEKPMATDSGECERMIRACRDAEVKLMIAYRLHFEPVNLRAVEVAQSGRLGELRYFSSQFGYQVKAGNIRVDPEQGGGPLWDIGIYCINASRYLFQAEPEEVFAYGAGIPGDARFGSVPATVTALLRFPGDRVATFTCSFGQAGMARYQLVGAEGELQLENAYNYVGERVLTVRGRGRTQRETFPATDQFAPELLQFSDCVLSSREPEPSGEEGLADVRIIEAMHASMRSGRAVSVRAVQRRRRPTRAQAIARPQVKAPREVGAEPPSAGH